MICPSCQEALFARCNRCPHCGSRIMRMESGVIKTSAVLIASDEVRAVYASVSDVPEYLRQRLVESTTGRNSGTIVIADRRGKEEIEKAARVEEQTPCVLPQGASSDWARMWPALVAIAVGTAGVCIAFLFRP